MKAKWITPAVTPFNEDGTPDFESAGKLYDKLIAAGIDGVLVGGSIGEFFAQSLETRIAFARFAAEHVAGRMKVIVGTANMVSEDIIKLSNTALEAGVDAVMIVPPFYFAFGDNEMLDFYTEMSAKINGPVYIYNFPDRTGYSISPAVVAKLAASCSNIVGIKDTITGMDHTRELIKAVKPVRPDFEIYSGFDDNFVHNVISGGDGCIGGMSNIDPELCVSWVRALENNDLEKAAEIQQKINRCVDIYTIGAPFVPYVKEAVRLTGGIRSAKATFPIPTLAESESAKVKAFLERENFI